MIETKKEGSIVILTLNNPKRLNSLSVMMLKDMKKRLLHIHDDKEIKTLIITGAGHGFSAGADIKEMAHMDKQTAKFFSHLGQSVTDIIAHMPQVTIAAINGYAVGGGLEIALACDLRICVHKTKVGLPEMSLGIIPGFGGTQRLQGIIGPAKAYDLIKEGSLISSSRAHKLGLIDILCLKPLVEAKKISKKAKTKHDARQFSHALHTSRRSKRLPSSFADENKRFAKSFGPKQRKKMFAFLK